MHCLSVEAYSLTVAKDKDFKAKPPLLSELPKANGEVNDSVFKLEILGTAVLYVLQ